MQWRLHGVAALGAVAIATLAAGCAPFGPYAGKLTVVVAADGVGGGATVDAVVYDRDTGATLGRGVGTFSSPAQLTLEEIDPASGQLSGVELTLAGGTYDLLLRVDEAGDGLAAPDPWRLATVAIDGNTAVSYDDTDLTPTVTASAKIQYQDELNGARMTVFWQRASSPLIESFFVSSIYAPGFIVAGSDVFTGGLAQTAGEMLAAGTYDATVLIDLNDNGVLESGDYRFQVQDVAVSGGTTSFNTAYGEATALP